MKKTFFASFMAMFLSISIFADNSISNGDFETTTAQSGLTNTYWFQPTNANQTLAIDNTSQISGANSLKATVVAVQTSISSLYCSQNLSLAKDATYTLTFKAKASAACTVQATIAQAFSPYTTNSSITCNVTTSVQTFTLNVPKTLVVSGLYRLLFYYGTAASGTNIWFDDVSLVETITPLSTRNLCNGDFEADAPNGMFTATGYSYSLIYGWTNLKLTTAANPSMTVATDNVSPISGLQSMKITSTGTPSATPNSNDLSLTWLFAGVKDKLYTVSFKAKASATCNIGVYLGAWAYSSNPTSSYIVEKTCNLTTAVQTFSFTSTAPFLASDGRNLLRFYFGKLPNGVSVWLDDVSIVQGVPVTSVTVSPTPVNVSVGSTFQLAASVLPVDATNPAIVWSSSDLTKATVSATGLVTALAAGTTTISATSVDGSKVGTSAFTISAGPIAVTALAVSPTTVSINKNATQQLTAIFTPLGATNKNVTWNSDNTAVATVDASGLVTGVNSGTANVTATSQDGSFVGTATVAVAIPVTGISITPSAGQIAIGTPYQLSPVLAPLNATNKTIKYYSNKESVAKVDSLTGLVSGITPGVAVITAKTTEGNFTSTYNVTVYGSNVVLPSVLGSNMVMQQNMMAAVWGWTAPNTSVAITASWGQTANATADAAGKWSTKIQTPKAVAGANQTKHTLAFVGANNTITLTNILIGDVYLCSGQSNMGFVMQKLLDAKGAVVTLGVLDYVNEIAAATYPNIRINRPATNPQYVPLENNSSSWNECSPTTVSNFPAVPYYFARELYNNPNINIPIGMLAPAVGGSSCQSWTRRESLAADSVLKTNYLVPNDAAPSLAYATASTVLYNGMIAPLIPFSLKGFLWYQGEANNSQTPTYAKLNSAMIKDWRNQWGQGDLPFYFVQLPAYSYFNVAFRDQQCNVLTLPNTGMAVTLDLADADLTNIHPQNKKEVAKRLARIAEAKLYGQSVVYAGPTFKSKSIEGSKIRITYHPISIGSGLASRDGQALNNFKIAGSDNLYVDATAVIDGNDVLVSSPSVVSPVNVSFAYAAAAIPNLMNKDSLTACQFKTDTWNNLISFDPILTAIEETKIISPTNEIVTVYPNPASDVLNLVFNKSLTDIRIQLIDVTGRVKYTSTTASEVSEKKIYLSSLPRGFYILKVQGEGLDFTKAVVVK